MKLTQDQLERISAYLDDEMSPVDRKHFEAEMQDYPEIKKKVSEFRELEKTLDLLEPLPEDTGFTNRLMDQVHQPERIFNLKKWHSAAAVALLIGVFALGIWNNEPIPNDRIAEASIMDGLRPLLTSETLSTEDVFNFALYQTLPIDTQREQVIKLGVHEDGREFITIQKVSDPNNVSNLKQFKEALTLNKGEEKRLDSILQGYLETLAKDALLTRGNTMALNADLWNYNRELVAEVLSFAEKANPQAFYKVLPASFGSDYYASLRNYNQGSQPSLEDTFIIISSGQNFSDPLVIDLGKMQSRIDSTDDQIVKLSLFLKEAKIKGSNNVDSEYHIDTVIGNQIGVKIDNGIYQIRVPKNMAMSQSIQISIPDLDSNIQGYFGHATNHLKVFSCDPSKAGKAYQFAISNYSGSCPQCGDKECKKCVVTLTDTGLFFATTHEKPYLGVFIRELSSKDATELGMNDTYGVFVDGLMKNGGAQKAGMEAGDVILKVGKVEVKDIKELRDIIRSHKAGDELKVQVLRDGKTKNIAVTLQKHQENHSYAIPSIPDMPDINIQIPDINYTIPPMPVVNMKEMQESNEELKKEMEELRRELEEMKKLLREDLEEEMEDQQDNDAPDNGGGENIGFDDRVYIGFV